MKEITLILKVDTTDLDEAIEKAKILNEELEKAKSMRFDLAERNTCIFVESSDVDTTKLIELFTNAKLQRSY